MQWDLYCRVVDNLGDVGVAWRLAADLAARGHSVRLAVDDASALAWMAPQSADRVAVVGWRDGPSASPDVVVELFGGGRPPEATASAARAPVLVNLEHLSAEGYVERSHGLPSPTQRPGEPPSITWFFYPGFTPRTGGLLREPGLKEGRRAFGRSDGWPASLGVASRAGERRVALFCYRNDALPELLDALAARPTLLLLAPGAATEQVSRQLGPSLTRAALRAVAMPLLSQRDFDLVLWSCDLNFVRGEDSFIRAMWAGSPFVWQAYVQEAGAHAAKVEAFVDRFLVDAPGALAVPLRSLFARWNGFGVSAIDARTLDAAEAAWRAHCVRWRDALAAQDDLVTRLIRFVESKR